MNKVGNADKWTVPPEGARFQRMTWYPPQPDPLQILRQAEYDFPPHNGDQFLNWAVESALRIMNASRGNLQIIDPSSGALHIVAQCGFRKPFLDFFNSVHTGRAACGTAFQTGARVVIEDVAESPIFRETSALEVLLDAGVRAVQSTPLVGPSGTIRGILSTHWSRPRHLPTRQFVPLDVLARALGRWLELNSND